jgi:hypothetical protein
MNGHPLLDVASILTLHSLIRTTTTGSLTLIASRPRDRRVG